MTEILQDFSEKSAESADSDNFIVEFQSTKDTPVTSSNSPYLNCCSARGNLVKLPSYCPNYAQRCVGCDAYLGSVPKPRRQRTRRVGLGGASW